MGPGFRRRPANVSRWQRNVLSAVALGRDFGLEVSRLGVLIAQAPGHWNAGWAGAKDRCRVYIQ